MLSLLHVQLVWSGEKLRRAVDFSHEFEGDQPYVFHWHNLEHEDGDMMVNMRARTEHARFRRLNSDNESGMEMGRMADDNENVIAHGIRSPSRAGPCTMQVIYHERVARIIIMTLTQVVVISG